MASASARSWASIAITRCETGDGSAAEPSAVHEELEILGENRDDLRYELRFSDMFAMDLAPNYDAAHQRSAFVQTDLPAQRFQSEAMPCAEATCIWQHNELRIDADEATWRGICDADSGAASCALQTGSAGLLCYQAPQPTQYWYN